MRKLHIAFHSGWPIYMPTDSALGFPFLHILTNTFIIFLMTVILTGMKWYFIVVLIFIYLMTSEVEHLFMYLLAICISSSGKCLFKSSTLLLFFWPHQMACGIFHHQESNPGSSHRKHRVLTSGHSGKTYPHF